MRPFTYRGGCNERGPDDVEAVSVFARRLVAEAERASCSVSSCGWLVSRACLGLARSAAPAVAAIEHGGPRAPGRCGRFHRQPPGSFPAAAARSGGRIVRAVGSACTASLGNWRPRAAQFAPWAVYIPGGGTTWCGRKERRMVTADLLSR